MRDLQTTLFIVQGKNQYYSDYTSFEDNFCAELEDLLFSSRLADSPFEKDIDKIYNFMKLLKEVKIKQQREEIIYNTSYVEDLFFSSCVLDKSFYENLKPNDHFSPLCFTPLNETGKIFLDFLIQFQISFRLISIYWGSKTENTLYLYPFHNDFTFENIL